MVLLLTSLCASGAVLGGDNSILHTAHTSLPPSLPPSSSQISSLVTLQLLAQASSKDAIDSPKYKVVHQNIR